MKKIIRYWLLIVLFILIGFYCPPSAIAERQSNLDDEANPEVSIATIQKKQFTYDLKLKVKNDQEDMTSGIYLISKLWKSNDPDEIIMGKSFRIGSHKEPIVIDIDKKTNSINLYYQNGTVWQPDFKIPGLISNTTKNDQINDVTYLPQQKLGNDTEDEPDEHDPCTHINIGDACNIEYCDYPESGCSTMNYICKIPGAITIEQYCLACDEGSPAYCNHAICITFPPGTEINGWSCLTNGVCCFFT